MIKWDLQQGIQGWLISENQLIWYSTLIDWEIKYLNRHKKSSDKILHWFMIKNSQQSGYWGKMPQYINMTYPQLTWYLTVKC